jgi:diadenosine tetraphosphatase ApaH/serine/threonine PP2A family protein phosphatase
MSMFQSLMGALSSPGGSPQSSRASVGAKHPTVSTRNARGGRGNNNASIDPDSPLKTMDDLEKDSLIQQLQNELLLKESMINALSSKVARLEDESGVAPMDEEDESNPNATATAASAQVMKRSHPLSCVTHIVGTEGKVTKAKVGTRGSILTTNILEAMPDETKSDAQGLAEKFVEVFQNPVEYMTYLQSAEFAHDLMKVCLAVEEMLEAESRCIFMQSPVYVFGDIHGNLEDLHFFSDNIWKLGMNLTAGKFLFIGDYVDRGMSSLECVAYLFGLKLLYPSKIHMLRGNHETRDVNGWEEHYHEKSFLYQCKDRFGIELGNEVWEEVNQAFDRLPFSAVIDHEIFCIHGGIPRPVDGFKNELHAILGLPTVAGIMPSYEHEDPWMKRMSADLIWSDPAPESMEPRLGVDGFGDSPRGGGAVCFGTNAIENFLEANGLSYVIRAHEAHAHGVSLSKGARVFTVFSTSKDHRQGSRAMAGCILVDFDKIQVINRSPKYKNKYVHRRTSVTLQSLTEEEVEDRRRLGLVRTSLGDEEYYRLKREMALEESKKKLVKAKAAATKQGAKIMQNANRDENDDFGLQFGEANENHIPSF